MTLIPALTPEQAELVGQLDPAFQPFALAHRARVLARGVPFEYEQTLRSPQEQAKEFAEKPGVAVAPGKSKHEIGFAYDGRGPRTPQEWQVYGQEAEELGLEWGGRYATPEPWHVEAKEERAGLAAYRALRVAGIMALFVTGLVWASTQPSQGGK